MRPWAVVILDDDGEPSAVHVFDSEGAADLFVLDTQASTVRICAYWHAS
jgi:hypothetical protein